MRILNKIKFIKLLPIILVGLFFIPVSKVFAATSPSLGTAADFSVLGALSVSSANTTTLSGNLGLSPGLEISRTGPWVVGGSEYFGTSSLAATAQTDALNAFNDLAGQSSDGLWVGNTSPVPGVWTAASDVTFDGTLTLNGDYDDVWVFQIGRDMTFSGSVVLTGNAQPCHVFWQIGRSATIASGSTFVGTLIASADITAVSGATVDGRLISLNSSITVDANNISGPVCATPTPTPTSTSTSTSSNSDTEIAYCPPITNTVVSPIIIESKRIDKDSIYIKWGPYSGTDQFNVQYGFENGKFLYNTNVTGFFVTINDLPLDQPVWIRVAARNDCQIGTYGEAKLVGGPRLPNTGFAPKNNNISLLLTQIINWIF